MKTILKLILLLLFSYCTSLSAIKIEIIAKVNNQVITNIDLENRLNLALAISNLPGDEEIRKQLKRQILDVLIDENLKIQESGRLGILVSSDEVYAEIKRLERNLNLQTNSLVKSLKEKNISENVIYNHIRSQLLWNKIISFTIANNISVTDKQKEENLQSFIKNSGEIEYNISEIFISNSEENNTSLSQEKLEFILSEVNISNFQSIAQQFSDGAVNINNWFRESMLNNETVKQIRPLNIGEISKPIKSSIGYHIYLINDRRKTKKIVENEKLYNLSQIFYKITEDNKKDFDDYVKKLESLKISIKGCDNLEKEIKNNQYSAGGSLGVLSADSIDPKFLEVIQSGLDVGTLSKTITTKQGIHSIMLCEPEIKVSLDNLKKNLEQRLKINKINNAASLLLNRIRQRALIEIDNL